MVRSTVDQPGMVNIERFPGLVGFFVDEKVLAPALLGVETVLLEEILGPQSGNVAVALSVRSARSPR